MYVCIFATRRWNVIGFLRWGNFVFWTGPSNGYSFSHIDWLAQNFAEDSRKKEMVSFLKFILASLVARYIYRGARALELEWKEYKNRPREEPPVHYTDAEWAERLAKVREQCGKEPVYMKAYTPVTKEQTKA